MEIYFDNAATTALDPQVLEAMLPYLTRQYGNPSSSHRLGQQARQAVETARRTIADLLGASPDEIYFTAGATEADNLALVGSIRMYNLRHAITSPIEHKAVLETLREQEKQRRIELHYLPLNRTGLFDWDYLERKLERHPGALVSLMHGNNELGNLTDIDSVGWLCREHKALFHSDAVQTMGRYRFNLKQAPIDFLVGSAHKFHGPKGVGFLYARRTHSLPSLWQGGSQERGLRPGTENVAGIIGLAKALEISYQNLARIQAHLYDLKQSLIRQLDTLDVQCNGQGNSPIDGMLTVINLSFPGLPNGDSLVSKLDRAGIAVSGGSACSNLTKAGSHVLKAIGAPTEREHIRISLSKDNTQDEIDQLTDLIHQIYSKVAALV
ncbi:cysteine desulfurase [Spirosoma sp. BT702]|uniref:cysteine desulfurase n=1 Tax=Spirosoma profusum TaxID=2771354 RepID=A0A927AW53_9BACT|nr:cysteine desulfurase family protein [Spirosoma profusum]MBD2705545.1 cysteine desulfurase [Spirosoma profusum]